MKLVKDSLKLYQRIILLLLSDIVFVVIASFLTMFIRTEFIMNWELWNNYLEVVYADITITLIIFAFFNLYKSL